jgi:signal transduction histidine kinase
VTSAAGGTGIGLALVKRFVSLLGGRVSASNNPGPGCTIGIDLPR